jgi:signal transduction histidine kinase
VIREDAASLPWEPTDALGVFVRLLSEIESATPSSGGFYDSLCEATCRLAHLRRAVIFLWDDGLREVRAVGSRDVPLSAFADSVVDPTNVPIARRALLEDRVVEAHERFDDYMPPDLVAALQPQNLVCTPMSAGGVWFGVLMGEREDDAPLSEAERHTLWTLGKVAALAASARVATRQQERARRLSERMDLARDVHDHAVQRMFGVAMALSVDGPLSDEHRRRCLDEVTEAMSELREAMQRPLAPVVAPARRPFADVLRRELTAHDDLRLRAEPDVVVPAAFDAIAHHVLVEAVRNARKHAQPTAIDLTLDRRADTVVLGIVNDGARPSTRDPGMGLRLVALEAVHAGALVEFGPDGDAGWAVRLIMPVDAG